MDLVTIIVLAVVQGITEFLPISSSGHLVIVNALLGQAENVNIVSIVLHGGTLFSILVFYRQRIFKLLYEDWYTVSLLVAATIPTAIIGLLLKSQLEEFLESPLLAGFMLPVTGILLWWSDRQPPRQGTYEDLSYKKAIFLGFTQAAALLPGISRSGTTIVAGMGVGLSRQAAATFSFLLAIFAIGGAMVLQMLRLTTEELTIHPFHLLVGALVAFLVGLVSLAWLMRWLERGQLRWFSYWCFVMGLTVILWHFAFSPASSSQLPVPTAVADTLK